MKKRTIGFFKFVFQVVKEYLADNVIKYSASLAYYTTLSLAPMLIIIITISGMVLGKDAMEGNIYNQIHGMVGNESAKQIQSMIQNVHLQSETPFAAMVSSGVLLIGATGIFGEMQDSLNKIWGLKTTNRKIWWKIILNRLISFSLILSLGFVMMVSLMLYAVIEAFGNKIGISQTTSLPIVNHLMSVAVSTILFATIFKVLPDAKIKWKDVFIGALITAVLFTLGKFLIGYYLGAGNFASLFGAAGSVVVIMIWVYYSSAILYLGAVFTKVYAINHGGKIEPNQYASWIVEKQVTVKEPTLA